jgi:hypothetical protein
LQCGRKSKVYDVRNLFRFFCTKRCAAKWAVQKAEATHDWCRKHGWHQAGHCSSCEPFDFGLEEVEEEEIEVEEWPETGWCPKCRSAKHLAPQLMFFYCEHFDDGAFEDHGRIHFEGWHCSHCQENYWHPDVFDGNYDDKASELWKEAWEKLGVNRITVLCAGPKPSYHRVYGG